MLTEGDKWRAPRRRRLSPPVVLASVGLLTVVALVVAVVMWLVGDRPAPRPAPPPTGARPLTVVESAGVTALIDQQNAGAHSLSGKISVNGRTLGIQLGYLADGSTGSGTLTAGGLRGDVLIDAAVVYLRGGQPFWAALGVAGAPPPGWVVLPPDFLGGKVFVSPAAWTAALLPTPAARLDGQTYYSGRGDASATIGDKGITHFAVAGVTADVRAVPAAEVTTAAGQLGNGRGPGIPLGRDPAGTWVLPPPPPAATTSTPTTTATPTSTTPTP
ncbi:hypothetical protein BB737_00360 [Mycobacterium avium subsp. hominissuis]|uniref:Uncharacterized protein n=3 Tax=Mycobacterium avium complex (MAC) TaxID=120793 RepID=A0AAW5SBB0_MYCBC|nr:hypothetical protein [Mycobacterium avium subsp. hominissuis]MCV6992815.1 hypothetical protein [Mycobacterium bouchedurhonense]MCV6993298.1 hypothetical protein [Mycobacterium timonense]MDV3306489.1 hypothetical protein [Mycobacterium avium subsp. hominissuis]ORA44507.1 hypothetical protein BST19_21290 [Mycobacterium bouchedurhonense]